MKIFILGTRGFPDIQGGVEKHCEQLAINLVDLGCDVTVFTRRPYVNYKFKKYKGINLISLPTLKHKSLEAFIHTFLGVLVSIYKRPDILHIQGIGPGVFSVLGRLFGIRIILTSHGSNYKHHKWNPLEKTLLQICEYIGIKSCNGVIAISPVIASEIFKKYNRLAEVIPNGIELATPCTTIDKLKELDLKKEKYILTVGRLVPEKGFHNLIEAFKNIDLPDWKLVIAGAADHMSSYSRKLMSNAASDKRIIFIGFSTGIPLIELYTNAGLFVLPSYYEGFPICLLEAISFNLPCIASDISGNRVIGLPEENYFPPDSIGALENKILDFSRIELKHEILLKQKALIGEHYNWKSVAKETLTIYTKLQRG